MQKKIRVGILFGGKSAEHEVSIQSAKNVVKALNKEKYEPVLIGIDKSGGWHLSDAILLMDGERGAVDAGGPNQENSALIPMEVQNQLMSGPGEELAPRIDVVFPVLHGPMGEDGTVQGFLKLASIPFVGASVLGSAIGMDKDVMKRLLRDAGIPVARFLVFKKPDEADFKNIEKVLGLPFFVKPANLGSSVGVSKVKDEKDFTDAVREAFSFDTKILAEEYIAGREIECSVLGNNEPIASLPGEVIPQHEFYSYEAKYLDENGALLEVPAKLPLETVKEIQELAIRAFSVLCCEGMARADFFLAKDGKVFLNEINTIPGFTNISMYPKLWEASGVSSTELINRLIELALERFEREKALMTTFL